MKHVLLLLPEGFEIYEASVFIDVIGWNSDEGDGTTILYSCGATSVVKSTFRQNLLVDYTIDQINITDYDALAIPGGWQEYGFYENGCQNDFLEIIRKFNEAGKIIAAICTGAVLLAKSGILQGRKATTHFIRQQKLVEAEAILQQESIVVDGNIITSQNPSSAIDVAFTLLKYLTSSENVRSVRKLMGFEGVATDD
jgi:4-methyl-5(b-hydroxyethyl)-thiazole monophosphate biosynthesis